MRWIQKIQINQQTHRVWNRSKKERLTFFSRVSSFWSIFVFPVQDYKKIVRPVAGIKIANREDVERFKGLGLFGNFLNSLYFLWG